MLLYRLPLALLAALALSGCATSTPGIPATPIAQVPTPAPAPTHATRQRLRLLPRQRPRQHGPRASHRPGPSDRDGAANRGSRATAAPTAAPAPTPSQVATLRPTPTGSELLFLRGGDLVAFEVASGGLRTLAEDVRDFAASRDGATIALLRGTGLQSEVWTVGRDGSGLAQVTNNDRAEASLAWAPDRAALAFGSSSSEAAYAREWLAWANWCVASEIHVLTLAGQVEAKLADGCDPAFSPDGRRIAYAAPPSAPGGRRAAS